MKTKELIIVCISLFAVACSTAEKDKDWPEITAESKPWTRWWWMGNAVDKENLSWQLEALNKAGIGGVEITPIYGVKGTEKRRIDFLSPEWMDVFFHTSSEAKRMGMQVDMNMGTGWPFGGPTVSLSDAASCAIFQEYVVTGGKQLTEPILVKSEKQKSVAELNCLMAYSPYGNCINLTKQVKPDGKLDWTAPTGETWRLIALFNGKTFQKVKRAAPGGEGYVLDHFNQEAVARYLAHFDQVFKEKGIPFPHSFFNDSYEVYGADWTPDLLEQFERRRGYRLQEHFPAFLSNGEKPESARIISDYRETLGELLKENFVDQWIEWAHERGISIRNQSHGSPANLIDLYAAVDIPECEIFGITDFNIPGIRKDSIRKINDGDPGTLKFASSAAHIAGKKYVSGETFTWLTEHFRTSLSQCKPEVDQMFLSGVNHVILHGTTYSPKEVAWPGWKFYASIDMSPTNTIWRDVPDFFKYITRVQSFLQSGKPDNDFLLYFPVYDIWEQQRGNNLMTFEIHGMRDRLPEFYRIVSRIKDDGYDVDYISDHWVCSTIVENGKLKTKGGATYNALILPSVNVIPSETLTHLLKLAEQGATLVFVSNYPERVPGFNPSEESQAAFQKAIAKLPRISKSSATESFAFGKGRIITGTDYSALLNACEIKSEAFKTDFGGEFIRRQHDSGHLYFLAMLQDKTIDEWIPLAVQAKSAVFFDPLTGEKGEAALRNQNGTTEVYLQLKPGQSVILKTFRTKQTGLSPWTYFHETGKNWRLTGNWSLSFVESVPEIKDSFELKSLGSWTDLPDERLKKNRGTARYRISFDFQKDPHRDYLLNLGDVRESARIYINGKSAGTVFSVPFEKRIGSWLKDGKNTIEIEVTNLPANSIADYDRRGIDWRIFEEINFVDINYKNSRFTHWETCPSGLLGPVEIKEIT